MHEDTSFPELCLDGFQMERSSLARALLAYPQAIFAALVWLRREHEAITLAMLTTDLALRARILCTLERLGSVEVGLERFCFMLTATNL